MRQHARLQDGVFDEEIVGGAEQVLVHVDAVHHEDVVEAEGASDDELSGRERIARRPGASSAMSTGRRPTGRASTSRLPYV